MRRYCRLIGTRLYSCIIVFHAIFCIPAADPRRVAVPAVPVRHPYPDPWNTRPARAGTGIDGYGYGSVRNTRGRPVSITNDFNGWYSTTRRFDQNRLMNEAFLVAPIRHSDQDATMAPASMTTMQTTFLCTPISHFTASQPASKPTNTLPLSIPMDINALRASKLRNLCYRCKQPGHHKHECPHWYDLH